MSEPLVIAVPVFSMLANAGFALRREVFVHERKVPEEEEFDADDLTATHLVAISEGEACGTLRLIRKPEHVKIGRVVVRMDFRGRGIARAMLTTAMEMMRAEGESRFHLNAQAGKTAFYEKFGFRALGPIFMDGGLPHRAMRNY